MDPGRQRFFFAVAFAGAFFGALVSTLRAALVSGLFFATN
jgi:hypothetical protein